MDENKKDQVLLKGTVIYIIGSFGTKILNFLIVPLYTYYIMPEDLGNYDLLVTTVSLFSPLLTMKISDAAYRWIIKEKENEVFYIAATYQLLFRNCLFCALFLISIHHFVPIWNCYYFIAILVGDRFLECLQKLLRGLKNQKLFAMSGLFHTAIFGGLNVVKICYLHEEVTALLQSSIISLYATILLILFLEKRLRIVDFKSDYRCCQKEMLHYSIPLVPSALSWWVMSASDRYIIRWLIGSAANGIYSVAYKFPSVLQVVFQMFNNAWMDMALSELGKGNKSEEYTKKTFQVFYKISFDMVFILIPFTKFVMNVILNVSYKEAAVYIGFLYLGTIFQGFSSFSGIGYLQGEDTGGAAKTSIYGAIINLGVDLICMKYMGLFAAAVSTFLGFFFMWLTRMKDIEKIFPIRINWNIFISYLAIAVVLALLIIWTSSAWDLILSFVAVVFFLLDNKKNMKQMLKMISTKVKGI